MTDKNMLDWEYADSFYNEEPQKKVRTFEEIARECEELAGEELVCEEKISNDELKEVAAKVGRIRELSIQKKPVPVIAKELGYDESFVSDVLITISGSPEDDSDMAIAYLLTF